MKNYQQGREKRSEERESEEVREYTSILCRGYSVILFGSRARNTNGPESDYDLLVIGKRCPPTPSSSAVDIHFVDLSSLERCVRDFDLVVIDAFYDGKLICDPLKVGGVRKLVMKRVEGLIRTENGWETV
ncbi:nucleotidyltransferase domain-containing protein [Sulfuracidifex tepidarius]|nr:nucleotidyltransferase domain-containing protein [Sulfuracidifex tepidarius]